ncbi:hypothetical protein [Pontibacter chitinilyticus]|uniref:hypothetical protein n=1 Tax=Pontibacter chitinilyticus TaxID=2674989 RepID=UPI00321B5B84
MWYLDLFSGSGESKNIVLDQPYVSEFKKKHEEFLTLDSISEKLKFYDDNRHLFEFPYNEFVVKDSFETHYTFNFKPAPHFLETHIYNPWFIEHSKEYLFHMGYTIDFQFHSCEQLWEEFIQIKDSLPLLKKFIKHEKKKLKALCEETAPGRFKYWYELKIVDAKVLAPRYELTKEYWKELLVMEIADYLLKLERFKEGQDAAPQKEQVNSTVNNSLKISEGTDKINKLSKRVKEDITFLGLFKSNEKAMDGFIKIMKSKGYLTEDEKWNFVDFDKGEILAIIKHLELAGIIKKLKYKAELGRVFNKRFGKILSIRAYQDEPRYDIEPSIAIALTNLKTPLKA